MRILGIDPGFGRAGYGVIEQKAGKWVEVAHGCITTSPKDSFVGRLDDLHQELEHAIGDFKPTHAAVEQLFFAKNAKTALEVGQARGVILLTFVQAKIPVYEFTPLQVKQALTGYGRAEKGQIQKMVAMILGLPNKKIQDDAADALAVAITCGASLPFLEKTKFSSPVRGG